MTAGSNRRVLLVEDSLADIELILEGLGQARVSDDVAIVRDGAEALSYLREPGRSLPDLVIMDLNLPKVSGHDVLASMRSDPRLRNVPVAVLTTSAAERDVIRSYELGANCFLTKPVKVDDFLFMIKCIESFWLGLVRTPA